MEQEYDIKLLREIAHKLRAGTVSDQEQAYFDKWYIQHKDELLELPEGYASKPLVIRDRMHDNLLAQVNAENPIKTFQIPGIWWKSAAAAVLLIGGLFFFINRNNSGAVKPDVAVVEQDIAPGRQSATLTLADGKKIVLSDAANGKLIEEAGVSITKAADGQLVYELKDKGQAAQNKINTLSTAKGETYRLRLPDGSLVWLNAASSLTYAFSLNERGERRVKLSGEAYFEIAKDKAHPFVVSTDRQEVQVLGTHFNVNSYSDEPVTATTLLEGSVKVISGKNTEVLKPGEQAMNSGNAILVNKVEVDNMVDWKSGEFYLNHVNFKLGMRKIARWYDVEVIYNASVPDDMEIGGWVSRTEKLSSVLKSIESAGLVKFRVEGRKIYVTK